MAITVLEFFFILSATKQSSTFYQQNDRVNQSGTVCSPTAGLISLKHESPLSGK